MSENNTIIAFTKPLTYTAMNECLEIFLARYPFLTSFTIGESLLGKQIPVVKIGDGANKILYVASHHGSEWLSSVIMLRYINEFCEHVRAKRRIYNVSSEYLLRSRTVYIVPMLNPDGVDIAINGVDIGCPMFERLLRMNRGSGDFSHWQANARGVDLNHNYNAGFVEYKRLEQSSGIFGGAPTRFSGESPESEPESSSLCSFIRAVGDIRILLSFHTQGEEIYWNFNGNCAPRAFSIAKILSRISGYRLSEPEDLAAFGGLKDWFISEYNRPAYTVECGKGENPLPLDAFISTYTKLRELLFTVPVLL